MLNARHRPVALKLSAYAAIAVAKLRSFAPYALMELILPGGSVMALLLWLYRRQRRGPVFEMGAIPRWRPATAGAPLEQSDPLAVGGPFDDPLLPCEVENAVVKPMMAKKTAIKRNQINRRAVTTPEI